MTQAGAPISLKARREHPPSAACSPTGQPLSRESLQALLAHEESVDGPLDTSITCTQQTAAQARLAGANIYGYGSVA